MNIWTPVRSQGSLRLWLDRPRPRLHLRLGYSEFHNVAALEEINTGINEELFFYRPRREVLEIFFCSKFINKNSTNWYMFVREYFPLLHSGRGGVSTHANPIHFNSADNNQQIWWHYAIRFNIVWKHASLSTIVVDVPTQNHLVQMRKRRYNCILWFRNPVWRFCVKSVKKRYSSLKAIYYKQIITTFVICWNKWLYIFLWFLITGHKVFCLKLSYFYRFLFSHVHADVMLYIIFVFFLVNGDRKILEVLILV